MAACPLDTKVRHSTGVSTANSTNKSQNYKSVESGNQLVLESLAVIAHCAQAPKKSMNMYQNIHSLYFFKAWSKTFEYDTFHPLTLRAPEECVEKRLISSSWSTQMINMREGSSYHIPPCQHKTYEARNILLPESHWSYAILW